MYLAKKFCSMGLHCKIRTDSKVTGAREFVRVSRDGKPDDLLNSAIGGFGSGAILGRLQGQGFLFACNFVNVIS